MKLTLYILITFSLLLACKKGKSDQEIHPIVSDYSKFFTSGQIGSLTKKIITFEEKTTNEIGIITIDSLPKGTTSMYHATQLANEIGVGKKDKNNGLLILISKYDRQIAIATGYGTETILTDSICKKIIEYTIVPEFKRGNYYKGIDTALDSIFIKWH
jgi:uncharacterized protein